MACCFLRPGTVSAKLLVIAYPILERPGALPPDKDWNTLDSSLGREPLGASGGLAPGRGLEPSRSRRLGVRRSASGGLAPGRGLERLHRPGVRRLRPASGGLAPDEDWNPALDPHHITRREASGGLAPGRGLERSSSVEEASEHAGVRGPCPRTRIGTAHRSSWPANAKRRPGALPPDEDWNNSEPLVTWMGRSVRGPCPRTRIGTREHRHVNASGHEASGGLAPGRGLERHTRHRGGGRVQRRPGALPPDKDWNVDLPALPKVTPGVRGPCPRTRIGTVDEHQWPTRRVGRPGALPPDEDWNRHRAGTCAGRPRLCPGACPRTRIGTSRCSS